MSNSYIEKCIQALPPEKQDAARAAFKDMSEGGDDNFFSKVLVTLEATSAYASTLPQAVTASGQRLLQEIDVRAKALSSRQAKDEQRDEVLREFIRQQITAVAVENALVRDGIVGGLNNQTVEFRRIERSISRLRHARVGGLLFLMFVGALVGAAGMAAYCWTRDQPELNAARKVAELEAAGIAWEHQRTEKGELIRFEGPRIAPNGITWRKNADGQFIGADILFYSAAAR